MLQSTWNGISAEFCISLRSTCKTDWSKYFQKLALKITWTSHGYNDENIVNWTCKWIKVSHFLPWTSKQPSTQAGAFPFIYASNGLNLKFKNELTLDSNALFFSIREESSTKAGFSIAQTSAHDIWLKIIAYLWENMNLININWALELMRCEFDRNTFAHIYVSTLSTLSLAFSSFVSGWLVYANV